MHFRKLRIAGLDVIALRQGMAGELGYEIQAPIQHHRELYDAILKAGKEFGIRRLGGRAVFINHLEACFPTVIIDYIPAFMSDNMLDYFNEFKAAMRSFETVNQIAGSFEGKEINDYYKSPIELGWSNVVKFDHEFIGRMALEEETAHPKRTMRTLVWNAEDVIEVYASLYRKGQPYHFMDMPLHGHAARPAGVPMGRQGDEGRKTGGCDHIPRLQLLLSADALVVPDRH
jgi:vanillate/3-O-methylgallate O-demethylase